MAGHDSEVIHRVAFAPAECGWRYPLPTNAALAWRRDGAGWVAEVALPPLPTGHLVVPSLAAVGSPNWHAALLDGDATAVSASIGRPAAQGAVALRQGPVEAPVDCFVTRAALAAPRLQFRVAAPSAPTDYLAVVSARPMRMPVPRPPKAPARALAVPPRTQMAAAEEIRSRICSPTCVSMALHHLGVAHEFGELVAGSYHRPTRLYGVWPQNLWAASRCGVLGAVETAVDWTAPLAALAAGYAVVASIAFPKGGLEGSPLPGSGGHLVIVRGLENNRVLANDPAARVAAEVPRSYDVEQFAAAWFANRGVFYLFARPDDALGQGGT